MNKTINKYTVLWCYRILWNVGVYKEVLFAGAGGWGRRIKNASGSGLQKCYRGKGRNGLARFRSDREPGLPGRESATRFQGFPALVQARHFRFRFL
ncbi:MAG: hypothetical protein BWX80_00807 [Candidatus Hydrogenedentes bacterium ADurb.Bin101]|jgi:hypothetical protein|nr:MAG: hypothetical protein BWX80_00807 [Candidatus Hydrogenedentes bacterium ADurb.Bin101]